MAWPKKLARFLPTGGLVADIPAFEVGPNHWTAGRNVQCREGFVGRIGGYREIYSPLTVEPLALLNVQRAGVNWWIYAGVNSQHVVEASTHSDVTLLGGLQSAPAPWQHSLMSLNGVPVHNNSLDAPMFWPGTIADKFEALPGWPAGAVAKRVVAHFYHLFALNMDESAGLFPNKLRWSSAAEPGTIPNAWTAAADNDAGDVELSDTPGELVTAATWRDALLVYKRGAIYAGMYVPGSQNVFEFRPLFRGVGALSPHGVATTERGQIVVSDGDIMLTDGARIDSIAASRVRRHLFSQLDQDNINQVFAVYYRSRREVWIGFPEAGNTFATLAWVYHLDHDAWSLRELDHVAAAAPGLVNDKATSDAWDDDADSWDSDTTIWNQQDFSRDEHLVLAHPVTETLTMADATDATGLPSSVAKHDMTFGEPERVKYLRRMHIRASAPAAVMFVRAGARMTPDSPIAWSAPVAVNAGEQVINLSALGRYISVEIEAAGVDLWTIPGFDLEVELRGYH